MAAQLGATAMQSMGWSVLFAREPEPEMEYVEDPGEGQGDETLILGSQPPQPKKPKGRGPFFLLLGVIAVAGLVVAMNPDMVLNLLGGTEPAPPPPAMPTAGKRVPPPATAPTPSTSTPTPAAPTPSAPAASTPASPAPAAGTTPAMPAPPAQPAAQAAPKPAPPPMPTPAPTTVVKAPAATGGVPTPAFAEGQRVTLKQDPGSPAGIGLSLDSAGVRPGPLVRTGATLIILDAELQNTGWIYSVKTEDGNRGWISEKHLASK